MFYFHWRVVWFYLHWWVGMSNEVSIWDLNWLWSVSNFLPLLCLLLISGDIVVLIIYVEIHWSINIIGINVVIVVSILIDIVVHLVVIIILHTIINVIVVSHSVVSIISDIVVSSVVIICDVVIDLIIVIISHIIDHIVNRLSDKILHNNLRSIVQQLILQPWIAESSQILIDKFNFYIFWGFLVFITFLYLHRLNWLLSFLYV